MSLYVAFSWSTLWSFFASIPVVFNDIYGFNVWQQGLAYLSIAIGCIVAMPFIPWQERLYTRTVSKRGPEARLYPAMVGGVTIWAGGMILAFSEGRGHWMGPVVAICICVGGIFHVFTSVFNYLADA